MNLFIARTANCLPRYSQVANDDVSRWGTWSKAYFVEDDYRFEKTPFRLYTTFEHRRERQIRAFIPSLHNGNSVHIPCPVSGRRDDKESLRIGRLLWQRIIRARGRRDDYRGPITRAEVMYMSLFPEADLRGKHLHHINLGRTHTLWRQQIEARLADARLRGVESLESLLLTLDDRPLNLMALTPREHYQIHLLEGTPYFGDRVEDALDAGSRMDDLESTNLELLTKMLNHERKTIYPQQSCAGSRLYDGSKRRFLVVVGRRWKVAFVRGERAISNGRKHGLRSA